MASPRQPLRWLFVNRWRGTIGPNVGLRQLVICCLQRGHEVHVASPWVDDWLDHLRADGARVHVVEGLEFTPRGRNPLAFFAHLARGLCGAQRLGKLARSLGADLIVVNGENMLFAPRAGRLAGCPVVVMMQGVRFAHLGRSTRLFFALQKRWVDCYVAISQVVADGLAAAGVEPARIATIFCGVDTHGYAPRPGEAELAKALGIPPDAPVVLSVCNLEPRKGVHHLLEAFAKLTKTAPRAVCVLVGGPTSPADGPYVADLHRRVRQLGLGGKVLFAGQRDDVPAVLALADVVAHPSETESFGRAIAEAMAAGKPVVGFRVDAVAELIEDNTTGLLVEPFDHGAFAQALGRLLSDADLRRRFGQAARERALELYNLEVNLPATVDRLEQLAADHLVPRLMAEADRGGDRLDPKAVTIVAARPEHLIGMARCHLACFPDQFTSHMGMKYAGAFYRSYLTHERGLAFVAVEGSSGDVVGLVVGGAPGIRGEFLASAKIKFFGRLLVRLVTDRVVLKALLSALGRKLHLLPAEPDIADQPAPEERWALLQVIAATDRARGTGVAGRLLETFRLACLEGGYQTMYLPVASDNARAIAFYRKHGWEIVHQAGASTFMRCPTAPTAGA